MTQEQNFVKYITHTIKGSTPGYMNQGTPRKAKSVDTPLCYVQTAQLQPIGHDWQGTTSPQVRICARCQLVQYKSKKGAWKNARTIKGRNKDVKKEAVRQAQLFESLEDL